MVLGSFSPRCAPETLSSSNCTSLHTIRSPRRVGFPFIRSGSPTSYPLCQEEDLHHLQLESPFSFSLFFRRISTLWGLTVLTCFTRPRLRPPPESLIPWTIVTTCFSRLLRHCLMTPRASVSGGPRYTLDRLIFRLYAVTFFPSPLTVLYTIFSPPPLTPIQGVSSGQKFRGYVSPDLGCLKPTFFFFHDVFFPYP